MSTAAQPKAQWPGLQAEAEVGDADEGVAVDDAVDPGDVGEASGVGCQELNGWNDKGPLWIV